MKIKLIWFLTAKKEESWVELALALNYKTIRVKNEALKSNKNYPNFD